MPASVSGEMRCGPPRSPLAQSHACVSRTRRSARERSVELIPLPGAQVLVHGREQRLVGAREGAPRAPHEARAILVAGDQPRDRAAALRDHVLLPRLLHSVHQLEAHGLELRRAYAVTAALRARATCVLRCTGARGIAMVVRVV